MKKGELKQFCIRGHDTLIVGKDSNGYCKRCKKEWESPLKNQFCSKGHNTFLTGRYKNGHCVVCKKEWFQQHIPPPKPQFCLKGHDTFVCGRIADGRCKMCIKINNQNMQPKNNIRHHERWLTDISYRLKRTLRGRLREVLKENKKQGSAVKNLGCTVEFLKHYIEQKFYGGMTWKNWGDAWELDHITALWKFNLASKEQFLKAAHYTNLQPLLIPDHNKKSAKDLSDWHKEKELI